MVEVDTQPQPNRGEYALRTDIAPDGSLPLTILGTTVAINVSDFLILKKS